MKLVPLYEEKFVPNELLNEDGAIDVQKVLNKYYPDKVVNQDFATIAAEAPGVYAEKHKNVELPVIFTQCGELQNVPISEIEFGSELTSNDGSDTADDPVYIVIKDQKKLLHSGYSRVIDAMMKYDDKITAYVLDCDSPDK